MVEAILSPSHFEILAQATAPSDNIPPTTRAAAMLALIGILLLGMLLVVIILLGGHWVRRWGGHRRRTTVPPDLILKRVSTAEPVRDNPTLPNDQTNTGDTLDTDDTKVT